MAEARNGRALIEIQDLPEELVFCRTTVGTPKSQIASKAHLPNGDGLPKCHLADRHPPEYFFTKRVKTLNRISPCSNCFGLKSEINHSNTTCPFCGESVRLLPDHLPDCEAAP